VPIVKSKYGLTVAVAHIESRRAGSASEFALFELRTAIFIRASAKAVSPLNKR